MRKATEEWLRSARDDLATIAEDVSRFVLASSSAPVGECEPPIHEEMAPIPNPRMA